MPHEAVVSVPPDGGWAWVIAAVCFIGMITIDVPSMGFQVVLPFFHDMLDMQNSTITIVFSTYTLLMQLLGPLAGGICNRFGFRITFFVGSVMMAIGLLGLFWASSFISILLLFGFLAGTGSSFVLIVCAVAPGLWFEMKRPIAIGIVSSATGCSLFTVFISEMWSDVLGWRYTFVFWTILSVFTGLLSFLLSQPPMIKLQGKADVLNLPVRGVTALDVVRTDQIKEIEMMQNPHDVPQDLLRTISKHTGAAMPNTSEKTEEEATTCWSTFLKSFLKCFGKSAAGSRPLYRKDIFYQGNLKQAPELSLQPTSTYLLPLSKLPTVNDVKEEEEGHWKIPEAVSRAISEMIDFSLLKSPIFLMIVIATFFCYVAMYIPSLHLKNVNKGLIDENCRLMLPTIMGAGMIIFRTLIGFMLHFFHRVSALIVIIVASFVSGLIFCSVTVSYATAYQICLAFFGGAFSSIINPLRSVVVIEKLGLDKLTSCMGMLFFVQGIACFIGLPIAELLNEKTGLIYAGLVFSGICYILTGVFFTIIGILGIYTKEPRSTDA